MPRGRKVRKAFIPTTRALRAAESGDLGLLLRSWGGFTRDPDVMATAYSQALEACQYQDFAEVDGAIPKSVRKIFAIMDSSLKEDPMFKSRLFRHYQDHRRRKYDSRLSGQAASAHEVAVPFSAHEVSTVSVDLTQGQAWRSAWGAPPVVASESFAQVLARGRVEAVHKATKVQVSQQHRDLALPVLQPSHPPVVSISGFVLRGEIKYRELSVDRFYNLIEALNGLLPQFRHLDILLANTNMAKGSEIIEHISEHDWNPQALYLHIQTQTTPTLLRIGGGIPGCEDLRYANWEPMYAGPLLQCIEFVASCPDVEPDTFRAMLHAISGLRDIVTPLARKLMLSSIPGSKDHSPKLFACLPEVKLTSDTFVQQAREKLVGGDFVSLVAA